MTSVGYYRIGSIHSFPSMYIILYFASILVQLQAERILAYYSNNAAANGYDDEYSAFQYDLSSFYMQFDKCQDIKMYNDDFAAENDSSPLAVKHFVLFRLCSTCGSTCENGPFGRYTLDLETYLQAAVEEQNRINQNAYNYNHDDANSQVIDAANYIQCQKFNANNDDQEGGDDGNVYYIGPRCSKKGVVLSVFADENCWQPNTNLSVETLLGGQISYDTISKVTSPSTTCMTCEETNNDQNANDRYDADNVNEMCEELYNAAAKCESKTGLQGGFIQTANNYENQVENEYMACTFIDSIRLKSYTESGEINAKVKQEVIVRVLSKEQIVALLSIATFFLSMIGLKYYFERKIAEVTCISPLSLRGDPIMT